MRRTVIAMLAAVSLVACNSDSGSDSEATAAPAASPETSTAATEPTAAAATDDGNAGEAAADEPVGGGTAAQVRSITVGGMGAEYAPPVRSIVNLGVSVRRTSVEEASEAAAIAAAYVLGAVEAAGVPSSGIQMSDFGINPAYDTFNYQVVTGYTVNMGYNVTFPDVDAVGSVLGAAIAAGGDDVRAYGVRFEPDPAALMDGARTKAWEDVRARAAATAELAGEPLGEVLDVHEKVLITTPQGMVQGGEGDSATFDIPVAPGTAGVTVLLTVTYAIGA